MRSPGFVLVVVGVCACASSRAPGGGGDDVGDDGGTDGAVVVDDASELLDGAVVAIDANESSQCTDALELIAGWQQPDGGRQWAPPSLALGPDGELVAAFNIDEQPLVVATRAADGTWPTTTLDPYNASFPSLAYTPDGTLHACWVRAPASIARGPLVCASRPPGGAWSTPAMIDINPSRAPAVTIDPSGRVNVVYKRDEGIGFAQRSSGGGWSLHVTNIGGLEGASVAYDPQGSEHAVWVQWYESYPALFERATGLVDGGQFASVMPRSLAVDSNGRLHVAFASNRTDAVTYAYRDADNVWHFERNIDGAPQIVTWSIGLALGEGGRVHVTYYERQIDLGWPNRMRLATRAPGGGWTIETLYEGPDYFQPHTSMRVRAGVAHVAFEAAVFGPPFFRRVYYARRCNPGEAL
jgi:hypothetical protein